MGVNKAKYAPKNGKKTKTSILLKRAERKAKKLLSRPPKRAPKTPKPRDPNAPKDVAPKPKPQNPAFQKWIPLFKREITMIETHLKHCERFRQHWRSQIDRMDDAELKAKWETGEVGNWTRLLDMMDRTREILLQAREMSSWAVSNKNLGIYKSLPGMKDFVLGAEKAKSTTVNGKTEAGSDHATESTDMDEVLENSAPAGADFIPLISKQTFKPPKDAADKEEREAATNTVTANSFFKVDIEPTPVDLTAISKKKIKKRAKEGIIEERKSAKKAKKEKKASMISLEQELEHEPDSALNSKLKSASVDFSAIETQLQTEIEAGTKAKEEREKAEADAKFAKKEKKRKRQSEGESEKELEKELKKAKKDKKEKKKRKAEGGADEVVLSQDEKKKKHKITA